MTLLYIAVAGMLGTLARYGLYNWIQGFTKGSFPAGTLVVNLAGSFVLGLVARYGTQALAMSPELRLAIMVGFCGAFTTMSAFSLESLGLMAAGDYWRAGLYMAGTLVGCIGAVAAGSAVANKLL